MQKIRLVPSPDSERAPLSEEEPMMRDEYFDIDAEKPGERDSELGVRGKPTHYKVVCISLYTQDIERLNDTVKELKRRGYTKANKSQLIRQALRQFDIDRLPPPEP